MIVVNHFRLKISAEVIDQILHDRGVAEELYIHRFIGIKHPKHMPAVFGRIVAIRWHYSDLIQNLWLLIDPVNTEIPHFLSLIAKAARVIAVAVPDQSIGTDRVGPAFICRTALLVHIEVGVEVLQIKVNRFCRKSPKKYSADSRVKMRTANRTPSKIGGSQMTK